MSMKEINLLAEQTIIITNETKPETIQEVLRQISRKMNEVIQVVNALTDDAKKRE